jgi:hypothetical protein
MIVDTTDTKQCAFMSLTCGIIDHNGKNSPVKAIYHFVSHIKVFMCIQVLVIVGTDVVFTSRPRREQADYDCHVP